MEEQETGIQVGRLKTGRQEDMKTVRQGDRETGRWETGRQVTGTQETCDREAGDVVRGSVVEPELPFLDGAGAVKKEAAPARAPALICV